MPIAFRQIDMSGMYYVLRMWSVMVLVAGLAVET